jgi:L-ascorbate metabolism protein UlaG (beta-lactamase superfamily)
MANHPRPTFTYLGHATVRCDLPDKEVVLIDPWVTTNPACPEDAKELPRLDAVLVTHAHGDHLGDAVEICRRHRPRVVVASHEVCGWLSGKGVENCSGMNLGGTQKVLDLQVTMVRADHSSGLLDGGVFLDGGVAAGYVVRLPGGFTFYHAGDTALFSDMQIIAEIYRPELAFLPIGDHYTMDPHQAARACRYLNVRRVIPIHWGTFPALTGTPERLQQEIETLGVNCDVVTLRPGERW